MILSRCGTLNFMEFTAMTKIIDADGHIVEPRTFWQDYVRRITGVIAAQNNGR